MCTWKERLRSAEVDVEGAIERFANKEERYIKYLKLFLKNNDFPDLVKAIEDKDISRAFECCHSLKGVVGNMGFRKLSANIFECTEILRSGSFEGVCEKINMVKDNYYQIIDIIEECL